MSRKKQEKLRSQEIERIPSICVAGGCGSYAAKKCRATESSGNTFFQFVTYRKKINQLLCP